MTSLLVSNNRCISSDNNDSSRGTVSINTQSQRERRSRRIDNLVKTTINNNKRNYNILDTREYVYEKTTLRGESRESCMNILDTKEKYFNQQTKALRRNNSSSNNAVVSDTQLSKLLNNNNNNNQTLKTKVRSEKATTRKTSTFNDEYHKAWIFKKWHILHTKKNILSLKCNVHDVVKEATLKTKPTETADEQQQEQYVFDLSLISFNINPSSTQDDVDAYPPPLVQLDDATPYSDDLSPISDDDFSSISDDEKQYQQTLKSLNNQFTNRLRNRNNSSNQNLNDEDCEDKDNVNTTTDELNNNKIKEDSYYERRLSRYISTGSGGCIGGNSNNNNLFNIRNKSKSLQQANVAFYWTHKNNSSSSNEYNYSTTTTNHHLSSVNIAVL